MIDMVHATVPAMGTTVHSAYRLIKHRSRPEAALLWFMPPFPQFGTTVHSTKKIDSKIAGLKSFLGI
jgi:hypothetical protein